MDKLGRPGCQSTESRTGARAASVDSRAGSLDILNRASLTPVAGRDRPEVAQVLGRDMPARLRALMALIQLPKVLKRDSARAGLAIVLGRDTPGAAPDGRGSTRLPRSLSSSNSSSLSACGRWMSSASPPLRRLPYRKHSASAPSPSRPPAAITAQSHQSLAASGAGSAALSCGAGVWVTGAVGVGFGVGVGVGVAVKTVNNENEEVFMETTSTCRPSSTATLPPSLETGTPATDSSAYLRRAAGGAKAVRKAGDSALVRRYFEKTGCTFVDSDLTLTYRSPTSIENATCVAGVGHKALVVSLWRRLLASRL